MNETPLQSDPQTPHPGFCQICGRGVASDADRLAGRAYPCGLCNEVKLATPASSGYVYPGPDPTAAPSSTIPPGAIPPYPGVPPVLPGKDIPNPGLAALLGLIPGVGAMYNGQYAKGIVHLIVFAVLSSLVDTNGIFLLFVFGWVAYQSIEAHHTARARRDGTLLPNPFGLNDIGERLGFGKSWPVYPPTGSVPPAAVPPPSAENSPQTPPQTPGWTSPSQQQAPTANWGAPWDTYRYQAPPVPPIASYPPQPPYTPIPGAFAGESYPPFDPAAYGPPPPPVGSRFPAGAIWLIALGTLFLLNTSGIFRNLNFRFFLPLLFIGLGIWQFVNKMTRTGFGMADDGTPDYRIRVFRAARGSVWLILLGVIFFLADFDILSWGRSWPLFLILAGVMTFLERAVYRGASYPYPPAAYSPTGYPPAGHPPTGSQPVTPAESSTVASVPYSSAVATEERDPSREGR